MALYAFVGALWHHRRRRHEVLPLHPKRGVNPPSTGRAVRDLELVAVVPHDGDRNCAAVSDGDVVPDGGGEDFGHVLPTWFENN